LIRNRIDIVHSHTDLPDFVLSNVLKLFLVVRYKRIKIVRTIHNSQLWPTHFNIGKYVETSFKTDNVIFISKDVKNAYKQLRAKYSLAESINQYFIPNGVDLEKYNNKIETNILEKLDITLDKTKINLLFVGRFVEQKGFDLIIELFNKLDLKSKNKFQVYAFGSGALGKLVNNNIPIKLYNPISNINEIYKYFDFLIMPSRFEGLPLVSLEASASKLPIIASNSPGLKETLPIDWDLYFKNESVNDLRNLLIQIANNSYNKKTLSSKSFEFVEKNFNLKKTVVLYNQLYIKLVNKYEKN